jgi:hypothetical protein
VIAAAAQSGGWTEVALAMLNVLQTIALAYLAADRHAIRQARAAGRGTRVEDAPTASSTRP